MLLPAGHKDTLFSLPGSASEEFVRGVADVAGTPLSHICGVMPLSSMFKQISAILGYQRPGSWTAWVQRQRHSGGEEVITHRSVRKMKEEVGG
jgi:hypothetical protein